MALDRHSPRTIAIFLTHLTFRYYLPLTGIGSVTVGGPYLFKKHVHKMWLNDDSWFFHLKDYDKYQESPSPAITTTTTGTLHWTDRFYLCCGSGRIRIILPHAIRTLGLPIRSGFKTESGPFCHRNLKSVFCLQTNTFSRCSIRCWLRYIFTIKKACFKNASKVLL